MNTALVDGSLFIKVNRHMTFFPFSPLNVTSMSGLNLDKYLCVNDFQRYDMNRQESLLQFTFTDELKGAQNADMLSFFFFHSWE